MIKITDALLGEHGVFYRLFDHCEAGLSGWGLEQVQAAGAQVASALASHAQVEDELLFTSLEEHLPADAGPLVVMRMEHQEIEGGLEKLPSVTDPEAARALLARILHTARDHFAKEEQVLFPLAGERLGEARLQELGRHWAARRGVSV